MSSSCRVRAARASDLYAIAPRRAGAPHDEVGVAPQKSKSSADWLVKSSSGKISARCRQKYLETIERRRTRGLWRTDYAENSTKRSGFFSHLRH